MAGTIKHFNISGNYIENEYIATQNNYTAADDTTHSTHLTGAVDVDYEEIAVSDHQTPVGKTVRAHSKLFDETTTFKYRFLDTPTGCKRLHLLYLYLTKEYRKGKSFIAPESTPDQFYNLFSGIVCRTVVKWTAAKKELVFLIKTLVERNIIILPNRKEIWTITQNHFSDINGNRYENLHSVHNPQKSVATVCRMVDILDPSATTESEIEDLRKSMFSTSAK